MEKFTKLESLVVPLPFANIDTDIIMPKEFLKSIKRTGFGEHVFASWRNKKDFNLNKDRYSGAQILLTGENFGCGSSREHAVWGLKEFGIRAIIAPSFAEIFYNNCIKNGLLPISLDSNSVEDLTTSCELNKGYKLHINLVKNIIKTPDDQMIRFTLDSSSQTRLLEGMDDIALTLTHKDKILKFEEQYKLNYPWMLK
jgi:3-isopropylmalate/(R)-2-methylmalate dehydratase small subunit